MHICWQVIEGGEKGKVIALATEAVVNKFFSIGVKNIQNECNKVAGKYRELWGAKTGLMNEYGLSITYTEGCKETLPDFILFEPATIHIKILDCYCSPDPHISATVQHSVNDPMNPVLTVYLKILAIIDSTIVWTGFSTSFPFIINHELLHACGDSPRLRKEIHDGVIRHTMICNEAINNLSSP